MGIGMRWCIYRHDARNAAAKGCREGNEWNRSVGFHKNIIIPESRKRRAKNRVGSEKQNYSDDVAAIIGKHGGHQRSSAHGDDQIGARRSFSGKKKKSLQHITLILEKRNGSTLWLYNGRREGGHVCEQGGPKIILFGHADAHAWLPLSLSLFFFWPRWQHRGARKLVSSQKFLCYNCGRERYGIEAKTGFWTNNNKGSEHKIGRPINAAAGGTVHGLMQGCYFGAETAYSGLGRSPERIRSLLGPRWTGTF